MKSRYKLVIFDFDGTLINSVADLAVATNRALAHFGLPQHPEDSYRFFVGNGVNMLFHRALPEELKNEEWVQKLRSVMIPYYTEHCTDLTKPYDGIPELLAKLMADGVKVAVASNKYQAATTSMVEHYFPDVPFVAALGQREGVPIKPNPVIIDDIMQLVECSRSEVLYVGDTAVDMQTARNAGIAAVGVTWGFRPRTELAAENPQFIVDTVEELEEIVFG